jgi:hypothetical protein
VVPWGLTSLQKKLARHQVEQVLLAWETDLIEAGLPLGGLEPVEVQVPGALSAGQQRVMATVGLTERGETLQAWSALRAGRQPEALPAADDELALTIQACALLHEAAAGTAPEGWQVELQAQGRQLSARFRTLLRLGQALVEGRNAEVLAEAEGAARDGDPLVASTVEALVASATSSHVRQLAHTRPATLDALRELTHYAARRPDRVRAVLAAESAPVGSWIAPGGGAVDRAEALLELCQALRQGGGVPEPVWAGARDDVLTVVVESWSAWDQDYRPARAVLWGCLQQDPQARFPLGEALRDWRPQLQRAVNDRPKLFELSVRLFELGIVPPVLEELSSLLVELEHQGEDAPGRALGVALTRVCRVESLGGEDGQAELALGAVEHLEASVSERTDWIAGQLRGWATCLRARLLLAEGAEDEVEPLLAGLLEAPPATLPIFRLRGWLVRAYLAAGDWALAKEQAQQALADMAGLESLPESYQEQDRAAAEALEAAGKPAEAGAYARLRTAALLDLVDASLGLGGDPAQAAWAEAQALAEPEDPRVYFVHARQAELAGQGPQAVAAATRGLGARPGPWLERRLRSLLERVGPR